MSNNRKFQKSEVMSDKILAEQEKNKEFVTTIDNYKIGIKKLIDLGNVVFKDLERYFGKHEIGYDSSFYDRCNKAVDEVNNFFKKYPEFLTTYFKDLDPAKSKQGFKIDDLFEEKYLATFSSIHNKLKEKSDNSKLIFRTKESIDTVNEIISNIKNINDLNIPEQIFVNRHITEFQEQYEYLLDLDKRVKEETKDDSKANAKLETDTGKMNLLDSFFGGLKWNFMDPKKEIAKTNNSESFFTSIIKNILKVNNKPVVEEKSNDKTPQAEAQATKSKETAISADTDKFANLPLEQVNSKAIIDKYNNDFQSYTHAVVDTAKAKCYSKVIEKYKEFSSCELRRPFAKVEDITKNADQCAKLEKSAEIAMENCMEIFNMATLNDDLIQKLLLDSTKVNAEANPTGINLSVHADKTVYNLVNEYYTSEGAKGMLENAYNSETVTQLLGDTAKMQAISDKTDEVLH